jgi:hypothetical protein
MAWLIGAPLAVAYAFFGLRVAALLARSWERRHPYRDSN